MDPLTDTSLWTLLGESREQRDQRHRELLRECLSDAGLQIAYQRYPLLRDPAPKIDGCA